MGKGRGQEGPAGGAGSCEIRGWRPQTQDASRTGRGFRAGRDLYLGTAP